MTDLLDFPTLSRRQEEILALVVRAYTESPEPVSSKLLVERYGLDVSSATVRNEMAVLEKLGYVHAPHTSAGRVPTAMGYRYIVRGLMEQSLTQAEQHYITQRFIEAPNAVDHWMRRAAMLLARTSSSASLVTAPTSPSANFKHVELIAIQGRLALMVLVLQGGVVQQRLLTLADPVPQEQLSHAATRINALCAELSPLAIRARVRGLSELEREVMQLIAETMERSPAQSTIYQDGLSEIIPRFDDGEGVQQAVRLFEEGDFLEMLISDVIPDTGDEQEAVRVVVAGDGRWQELSQLSLVLMRYGVRGQMGGALGVVGSTRLNYGRAVSAVRTIGALITERLADLTDTDDPKLP